MGLIQDLEGLYALEGLDDPRAKWFVDLTDPQGAGVRIDPWGEADDLVLTFRDWGRPTGVSVGADRITGTWPASREIYLDSRVEHPEGNIPETFPGLKITLRLPSNRVPKADADGMIRFRFPVLQGWDKYGFHLQPSLTPEEVTAGNVRPEHVVDSIAVYHVTKRNNSYTTGKACHIYRPFVRDSLGHFAWGAWEVDEASQALVKAFPAEALSGASWYEVDADIGNTALGGTTLNFGNLFAHALSGLVQTTGTNQTITSLSFYCNSLQGNDGAHRFALYSDSSGSPNALLGTSAEVSGAVASAWNSADCSIVVGSGADLHFGMICSTTRRGLYDSSQSHTRIYVANTYSAGFPDPFGTPTVQNYRLSCYATYTPAGGGTTHDLTPGKVKLVGQTSSLASSPMLYGKLRIGGTRSSKSIEFATERGQLVIDGKLIEAAVFVGTQIAVTSGKLRLAGSTPTIDVSQLMDPGIIRFLGSQIDAFATQLNVDIDTLPGFLRFRGSNIETLITGTGKSGVRRLQQTKRAAQRSRSNYVPADFGIFFKPEEGIKQIPTELLKQKKQYRDIEKQLTEEFEELQALTQYVERLEKELKVVEDGNKLTSLQIELKTTQAERELIERKIQELQFKALLIEDEELLLLIIA